jgi:DNA-binding response OmpR family regulator
MRIQVVEDEPDLARHIVAALSTMGHSVTVSHDGAIALREALISSPDLIVLDLNLPSLDGLSVLQQLREKQCPSRVIILTAQGDVEHRVKGLKAGADDYLTKPFVMDELLARIEVLGRRGIAIEANNILRVADLVMDVAARRIIRSGERIEISPREFDVLQILMREPGRTFSRDEICGRIWEREHQYDTRTVEIFIMRLRRKLDFGGKPALIHTVRGLGYRLQVPE